MDRLQHPGDGWDLTLRHMPENVAIKMNRAALPPAIGQILTYALYKRLAGIGDNQLDARKTATLEKLEKERPSALVFLGLFGNAHNLPIRIGIHSNDVELQF